MNNKDFYKDTFSRISAPDVDWERFQAPSRRARTVFPLATAAAIALLLFGLVALVHYLSPQDLAPTQAVQPSAPSPVVVSASPEPTLGSPLALEDLLLDRNGTLCLSGPLSSPEGAALEEYRMALARYPGGTPQDAGMERYYCYKVYTLQEAQELEDLVGRHDLYLYTRYRVVETAHDWKDWMGEDFLGENTLFSGYLHEEGTLHLDAETQMSGAGTVEFQFFRAVKGSFHDVTVSLEDLDSFRQWSYVTADGVEVLLALGYGRALVLADLPDSFVSALVLAGASADNSAVTPADLEAFADGLNLAALTPVVTPPLPPALPVPSDQPLPYISDIDRRAYYAQALKQFLYHGTLPNGIDLDVPEEEDRSGNTFAIYDVDGDGQEELILLYTDTYMAAMTGLVMTVDASYQGPGAPLREELCDFTALTFYDNGYIKVEASHNQGKARDVLWPYVLYRYDSDHDCYERVAIVDAIDGALLSSQSDPTEEEARALDQYLVDADDVDDSAPPMNAQQYNAWLESHLGGARELQPEFLPVTEENINSFLPAG